MSALCALTVQGQGHNQRQAQFFGNLKEHIGVHCCWKMEYVICTSETLVHCHKCNKTLVHETPNPVLNEGVTMTNTLKQVSCACYDTVPFLKADHLRKDV